MKKYIFFLFLLCPFCFTSVAQMSDSTVKLHSINFEIGTFSPDLGALEDEVLPSVGLSGEFGTNVNLGGNIKVLLPYELQARFGVNYWSDEFDNETVENDHISTRNTFIRYGLGVFYAPSALGFWPQGRSKKLIQPYAGVDFQYYNIKTKINDPGVAQVRHGKDMMYTPTIGADALVLDMFNVGLEVRYNLSNYDQKVEDAPDVQVSAKGFEWRLLVGYRF